MTDFVCMVYQQAPSLQEPLLQAVGFVFDSAQTSSTQTPPPPSHHGKPSQGLQGVMTCEGIWNLALVCSTGHLSQPHNGLVVYCYFVSWSAVQTVMTATMFQ
jgi:hypothetical protein